jgi:hypothetical protein
LVRVAVAIGRRFEIPAQLGAGFASHCANGANMLQGIPCLAIRLCKRCILAEELHHPCLSHGGFIS